MSRDWTSFENIVYRTMHPPKSPPQGTLGGGGGDGPSAAPPPSAAPLVSPLPQTPRTRPPSESEFEKLFNKVVELSSKMDIVMSSINTKWTELFSRLDGMIVAANLNKQKDPRLSGDMIDAEAEEAINSFITALDATPKPDQVPTEGVSSPIPSSSRPSTEPESPWSSSTATEEDGGFNKEEIIQRLSSYIKLLQSKNIKLFDENHDRIVKSFPVMERLRSVGIGTLRPPPP